VADTGGVNPNADLMRPRIGQRDVGDVEQLVAEIAEDGGAH
jgi:hypothetical protein